MINNKAEALNSIDLTLGDSYDALFAILGKEIDIYHELEEDMEKERQVLLKPSLSAIQESNSRKETRLLKAKILEDARTKIIRKLARELELNEKEISLSVLASGAGEERKKRLKKLQAELNELAGRIFAMNETNRHMIDVSLDYVRNSINFINRLLQPELGYSPVGEMKAEILHGKIIKTKG